MTNFRVVGFLLAVAVAVGSWLLTCVAWRFDEIAAGVVPLDPRSFSRLTLVTLGTAGDQENHNRRGPSTAVAIGNHVFLVDAGRGVAESLRNASLPPSQPDAVLLTSLMPENTLGLDDLLAMGWEAGRRVPVQLFGPPGTAAVAAAVERAIEAGVRARAEGLGLDAAAPRFLVEEISDGWTAQRDDLAVRAAALPGGPLPALGYRFEWQGRSAVISGTGRSLEALAKLAAGANALVCEAVFVPDEAQVKELGLEDDADRLRRERSLHTSLEDAGRLAARSGVETLVLVRLRPPPVFDFQITSVVGDLFDGRILIPDDGDEITP